MRIRVLGFTAVVVLVLVFWAALTWSPQWGSWGRLLIALAIGTFVGARLLFPRVSMLPWRWKWPRVIDEEAEPPQDSAESTPRLEQANSGDVSVNQGLPPHSHFRGRKAELRELTELHDRLTARLLTESPKRGSPFTILIHGKAGVGKTAFAQQLARELSGRYERPVLYANLGYAGDAASSDEVLRTFIEQLGWPEDVPEAGPRRASLFRSMIEGRSLLVVLDAVRARWQVLDLLPDSIRCTVIITSRRDLTPEFGFQSFQLQVLTADDAIEMLYAVAQRRQSFPMSASILTDLCGQLPRALSIVGGWVLRDGRDLVDGARWVQLSGGIGETERLKRLTGYGESVQEGFMVEYSDLDPALKRVLCLTSVISSATFTAQTVADLLACTAEEAQASCGALRALQFLDVMEQGEHSEEPVYYLHPLMRLFAADRLEHEFSGERDTARDLLDAAMARHVEEVVACMDSCMDKAGQQAQARATAAAANPNEWLRRMLPEIAQGLDHTVDPIVTRRILGLAQGLMGHSCDFARMSGLIGRALQESADPLTKADLLLARAAIFVAVENYVAAQEDLNETEQLLAGPETDHDLHYRRAAVSRTRAQAFAQMRLPQTADDLFHKAKGQLQAIGTERAVYEGRVIELLSYVSHGHNMPDVEYPPEEFAEPDRFWIYLEHHEENRSQRRWPQALAELDKALACCAGDIRKEANLSYRRARLHLEHSEKDFAEQTRQARLAVRRSADTVRLFRAMGNQVGEVRALCLLVRSLAAAGEIDEGSLHLDRADELFHDEALRAIAGPALLPLEARITAARGELFLAQAKAAGPDSAEHRRSAAEHFRKAVNLFERIGDGRNRNRYMGRV